MRGFLTALRSMMGPRFFSTDYGGLEDVNHELSFSSSFRLFLIGWRFSAAFIRLFPSRLQRPGPNYNDKRKTGYGILQYRVRRP